MTPAEVAEQQRRRIIVAVATTLHERGFANSTVADVLAGSGVSRKTFYQQFSNLTDAVVAAHDLLDEAVGRIELLGRGDGNAVERLEEGVMEVIRVFGKEPALAWLLLVESGAASDGTRRRQQEFFGRVADSLSVAISQIVGYQVPSDGIPLALVGAVAELLRAKLYNPESDDMLAEFESIMPTVRELGIALLNLSRRTDRPTTN